MTEPVGCFIDFDSVRANIAEGAVVGGVRYRTRPPDRGCLHAQVVYGTLHRGMVDVACVEDGCDHAWYQVRVVEP